MPEQTFFADSAAEVGLNADKVQALIDRAERDVREGILPACQVAIARPALSYDVSVTTQPLSAVPLFVVQVLDK